MYLAFAELAGAAIVACACTLVATPLAAVAARRCGILDHPHGYKAHPSAVPLLGGVALAVGILCGVAWAGKWERATVAELLALGVGGGTILLCGLYDDVRGLSPTQKFVWQTVAVSAGACSLMAFGVHLDLFRAWPSIAIVVLTFLWVVGVTNAVNFLDNMNGLCAGLAAISAWALAAVNVRCGEMHVALVAACLGGAALGFLPYNWPHARIFLGDAGSMLIGFLLAALSVMGVYTRGAGVPTVAVLTPLFVLALPVLDAVIVIGLRLRAGRPPWIGDRCHISHRLVRRGMTPATAVVVLWLASAACGAAALLLPTVGLAQAPLLFILIVCALAALAGAAGTRGLS